jgi:hypothetical protein
MQDEHANPRSAGSDFFSPGWWEHFAYVWNSSEHKSCLSGLGETLIEVSDKFVEVALIWGPAGDLVVSTACRPITLRLIATSANWEALVRGDFAPIDGVLRGRIRIEGDAKRMMGYIEEISRMCALARVMT